MINRRELLQAAGIAFAAPQVHAQATRRSAHGGLAEDLPYADLRGL